MRIIRLRLLILALMAITPMATVCQGDAANLVGIQGMDITIEQIGENVCQLSQDDLKRSAKFILGQSNIHISNSTLQDRPGTRGTYGAYYYIRVTMPADCHVASVEVELRTSAEIEASGLTTLVTVWELGGILGGSPSTMRKSITDSVEEYTKQFVNDWNSVNNPK